MTKLIKYAKQDNHIIAGIFDENEKLFGFTVADLHLERATAKTFDTAYEAMEWAESNYNDLFLNE